MINGLVCAVCARVLDSHPVFGWTHTAQDSPADHPAVPASRDEIMTRARCDFCNGENPPWVVPASSFVVASGHGSDGDWAACDSCVKYIQRDDWDGLVRHVVNQYGRSRELSASLTLLYLALRQNLRGKPVRLDSTP